MTMDTWTYILGQFVSETNEVQVKQADLEVVGIVPSVAEICAGEAISYTVTVRNNGPDDVAGAPFTFQLPTGIDVADGDIVFESTCGSEASRSEEHTSELQSLMRISYPVFCLKKKYRHHI